MSSLAVPLLAAAMLAAPQPAWSAAIAAPAQPAIGGPYEPIDPPIVVEGKLPAAPPAWTIRPDPRLERRYAPRERQPVNRVILRFQA
jgi:hypothetical protein